MPFVSKAQARWGNSPAGRKALGDVDEWNRSTDFHHLPEKHSMATHNVDLGKKGSFKVKEGSLHRMLHVPQGEKIGEEKMKKASHSSNPTLRKKAISGLGLSHMHHG
jgi:hypothetical protein